MNSQQLYQRERNRKKRQRQKFLLVLCLIFVYFLGYLTAMGIEWKYGEDTTKQQEATRVETPYAKDKASEVPIKTPTQKVQDVLSSQNAGVENTYFDDALFIGNSRTEGFMMYTGLNNATYYTSKGLMVDTVFTKEIVKQNEKYVTAIEAMKSKSFQKIYIMLGINELGWAYPTIFYDKYGVLIDTIKEIQPSAHIYIQSILPVSLEKSLADKTYNNKNIDGYNEMLQALAKEKEVSYLNVGQGLMDETGSLPKEASGDGVHLNKEYSMKWLDYLKKHTKERDDVIVEAGSEQ